MLPLLISFAAATSLLRFNASGKISDGYKIDFYLGNPPVRTPKLILDTGSSLTLMPCAACVKCQGGLEKGLYDPLVSFTSSTIKCVRLFGVRIHTTPSAIEDVPKINNFASSIRST